MNADAPKDLVRLFQLGNVHAFELLFEQYRVPIFNFVYRMLNGDRESAEDLLSEIFMKLHDAREFYEPKARFSTWLFTIARNHCLNRVKSRNYRQSRSTVSLEELAQNTNGPSAPDRLMQLSVPDDSQQADMRELLEQAIGGLPDEYKEVFVLHAVEGFAHEEVARILDLLGTNKPAKFFRGKGCTQCHQTGYRGRIAIHELLEINDPMRKLISRDPGLDELRQQAIASGLVTLKDDGLAKVSQGLTTVEEVLRVCS